jgi:hypothetical protein
LGQTLAGLSDATRSSEWAVLGLILGKRLRNGFLFRRNTLPDHFPVSSCTAVLPVKHWSSTSKSTYTNKLKNITLNGSQNYEPKKLTSTFALFLNK